MFTGLIEQIGEVHSVRQTDAGRELRIQAPFNDLDTGESIAVNGACLTVRDFGADWFEAAAVTTTLERTTIGDWKHATVSAATLFRDMLIASEWSLPESCAVTHSSSTYPSRSRWKHSL
jgi:riboflavin synthase alpha subunit